MLNRKLSNYIYYGIIGAIVVVILLARSVLVGGIDSTIEQTQNDINLLTVQIDMLEQTVQENRDVQTAHIYDLNKYVPSVYNRETLENKVESKLESLGITEEQDYNRDVDVNTTVNLQGNELLHEYTTEYGYVEVKVTFTTNDIDLIYSFIDEMYEEEQLFVLGYALFDVPLNQNYVVVSLTYYTFYDDVVIQDVSK